LQKRQKRSSLQIISWRRKLGLAKVEWSACLRVPLCNILYKTVNTYVLPACCNCQRAKQGRWACIHLQRHGFAKGISSEWPSWHIQHISSTLSSSCLLTSRLKVTTASHIVTRFSCGG
jgi:hypothetical protein